MSYFTKSTFDFLNQLKKNNNKEWFSENKETYEKVAREPFLKFIEDFAPHLKKTAPNHLAIAKKTGGSLFRINKDLRFASRDEPYKTWIAAQFKHNNGKDVHAPGFYLHIEPKNSFFGGGVWHPDTQTCNKIRNAIATNSSEWKKIINNKTFKNTFIMEGDVLQKPPKGFDVNHPCIEDILRKDFIVTHALKQEDIVSEKFLNMIVDLSQKSAHYVQFLTIACGFKWN